MPSGGGLDREKAASCEATPYSDPAPPSVARPAGLGASVLISENWYKLMIDAANWGTRPAVSTTMPSHTRRRADALDEYTPLTRRLCDPLTRQLGMGSR